MRGADLLAQALELAGVRNLYSLSGNQIMPIYDACIDTSVQIIHSRHEAAAVFMADASAQLTGGIGVCLVTAGPGAANAVGALFSARQSESPVLLLTGDSPVRMDGRGAFQELDQVAMTSALTKLSFRTESVDHLARDVALAIRTALSGRPGPVHLALPFDVVQAQINDADLPLPESFDREVLPAEQHELDSLLSAIAYADKPLVFCGPCLNDSRAGDLSAELTESIDAPVIPMESPRGLNDPSLGEIQSIVGAVDLIVCLGKPVNFSLNFGQPREPASTKSPVAKWIIIDADQAELDRARANLGDRLAQQITADPRDVAQVLIASGSRAASKVPWRSQVASVIKARRFSTDTKTCASGITPAQLCAVVQHRIKASSSSVVICDGGEFGQWAQAVTKGTSRIINGPSGAIGGGLCYAVAACKERPESTVFALMGDGTVGFHFAEFETAVREHTPFIAVIGNDECWNAEHQIQLRDYGADRLSGCSLSGARYDQAVAALGGYGEYVSELEALDGALERAISSGVVACINVRIVGTPAPHGG